MENIDPQKKCSKCKHCEEIKPLGIFDYCRDCTNAYARKKYIENKKKRLDSIKRWRENNPGFLKEKINCECGCVISKGSKSTHMKSKKHSELLMKNNNNNPLDV
jgi:hypothetical protein